jgi:hypothetical protein
MGYARSPEGGERKPPGSDETVLRGIRRTFCSPLRRRIWGPMWQLKDFQGQICRTVAFVTNRYGGAMGIGTCVRNSPHKVTRVVV